MENLTHTHANFLNTLMFRWLRVCVCVCVYVSVFVAEWKRSNRPVCVCSPE